MTDSIERLVRDALSDKRHDSFSAGFSDRTVARWRAAHSSVSLGDVISRDFKRLAPLAIAATMLLAFYNARSSATSPALDRLLGLTTVTVDAAYDFSASGTTLQKN